jgi:Rod binding domain-containing protein
MPTFSPLPGATAASPVLSAAAATLSPDQIAKTKKAAEAFEAMAIGELLRPMFKTVDTSKGLFGGGQGEAAWQPMMVDEMAKLLAKRGGIGIADAVYEEMLRMQAGDAGPAGGPA